MAATAREQIEAALRAHAWTFQRSTTTSLFATKAAPAHAMFAIFSRAGALTFATYDGARITGAQPIAQIITKINAS